MRSVLKTPQPESRPYLSWSQAKVGGFLNLVVMKYKLVQHSPILAWYAE